MDKSFFTPTEDITCVFRKVTRAQRERAVHAWEQHPGQELQGEYFVIWHSLTSLTCGNSHNNNVRLPSDLQTLTFGVEFNQSLDKVNLPVTCNVGYN